MQEIENQVLLFVQSRDSVQKKLTQAHNNKDGNPAPMPSLELKYNYQNLSSMNRTGLAILLSCTLYTHKSSGDIHNEITTELIRDFPTFNPVMQNWMLVYAHYKDHISMNKQNTIKTLINFNLYARQK